MLNCRKAFFTLIKDAAMKRVLIALVTSCLLVLSPSSWAVQHDQQSLIILSYHEIIEPKQAYSPAYAVSPTSLAQQLEWLKGEGYHFVSMSDVLADRSGKRALPAKPVLLTFDDGYESFYTQAYPLLKKYNAPAVIALVGSWLEEKGMVNFDGLKIPRSELMSWEQIREVQKSGLVEVGSHSNALHCGSLANPQGNKEPAATSRLYSPETHKYETEAVYTKRVYADLKRNSDLLQQRLGTRPRIMVWPYGSHNAIARAAAAKAGMPIGLTLDDGANTHATPLPQLRRILLEQTSTLNSLARDIYARQHNLTDNDRAAKIMHVDLDNVYDPDPEQQERNLGHLLDRILAMGVNTVYLQAFSDPDGNGSADALYFPNRHLPMRADLFNRVVWQINTRTKVKRVYAWMPLLAFDLPAKEAAAKDVVVTQQNDPTHLVMGYHRLSPFSPRARAVIRDIYQDLSRSVAFEGLLFHDDVTLSDYEDNSPIALATYKKWGLPTDLAKIRGNNDQLVRWAQLKTNMLDGFAHELSQLVREEQPDLKTARNLYAQVVLNPQSETWYSQSLPNSIAKYDFTAIMAMPYMEQAANPEAFYRDLVTHVKAIPGAMDKVVFELQATDWRTNKLIPSEEMASTIRLLYSLGVRHVGYYPDNISHDHPDPAQLKPAFDSQSSLLQIPQLPPDAAPASAPAAAAAAEPGPIAPATPATSTSVPAR